MGRVAAMRVGWMPGSTSGDSKWPARLRGGWPPALRYPVRMRVDFTERVLRGLYSATLYVLAPITLYHLIWR